MGKPSIGSRFRTAWNAFLNRDPTINTSYGLGGGYYGTRPDRPRFSYSNERTLTSAIFTRIGIDIASFKILHVKTDKRGYYQSTVNSGLNYCLTTEANIDQTGAHFIQDIVMSMCDEGCVAVVAVDMTRKSAQSNSYDVETMRTGKILEWFPRHVKIQLYNDRFGRHEEVIMPKDQVAIIENPFYSVMNEPNSTLRRLTQKLSLLDVTDNQNSSGKLDLILQLPYVVRTETRRAEASRRREDIEKQLSGSKYGIAYTDGTEKITQLNRPVENNLLTQVEYLTKMLYSQLGISENILNGTANEQEMLNYRYHTLEPIASAIINELQRVFLTKTARTQGQTLMIFTDAFKLVPINNLAEIADKFTRNEILTSNEVRSIAGFPPSDDPKADKLQNKNMPLPDGEGFEQEPVESNDRYDQVVNDLLSGLEADIDAILKDQTQ